MSQSNCLLPNCLLIVTAEVDSEVEAEWSRWYDEVHLPDALACPGVLAGRRYRSVGEIAESDRGERRRSRTTLWTTVYELDSPAAVESSRRCAAGVRSPRACARRPGS